ncbi:MAG: methyltransferase domain-containing protein [Acidobacteriota bacterium]
MRRVLTTEHLDVGSHPDTLIADDLLQVRRVNRYFGGLRLVLSELERLLRVDGPAEPVRILDVATGSADLPLGIVEWARRRGLDIHVSAIELNPQVMRCARARTRPVPQVSLVRADALALPVRPSSCHYVFCSLFLHQLEEATGIRLLRNLLELAGRAVVINDLRRHRLHYAAAWTLAHACTRNPITRHDAPASVRNSYTLEEMRDLAAASGARDAEITRYWPFRACLVLRP